MKFAKLIAALFGALILAATWAASPALATTGTFVQTSDWVPPAAAVAAGAAGSQLGTGGWYDFHGSKWAINSSGQLVATLATSVANWNLGELNRSELEATVDSQVVTHFVQTQVTTANGSAAIYNYHRWSNSGTAATGYALSCDTTSGTNTNGYLQFLSLVSGTAVSLKSTTSYTMTAGTAYVCKTSVVQTSATQTTLSITLYASDGATVLASDSYVDTTTALQNVSGSNAIYGYSSATTPQPSQITELTTYTDVTLATIAPSSTMFHFSPRNWQCYGQTACASGVTNPRTIQAGAYYCAAWTASATPSATLALPVNANAMTISYFVNGIVYDNITVTRGALPLSGVTPGAAIQLMVVARAIGNPGANIWGQTGATFYGLEADGLVLDSGSTSGVALAPCQPSGQTGIAYVGWWTPQGNSISVGFHVDAGSDNFLHSNMWMVAQSMFAKGYDMGSISSSGSGILYAGAAYANFVPGLCIVATAGGACTPASRWNLVDQGISALDSNGHISAHGATGTEPALIITPNGTNDANEAVSTSLFPSAVTQLLATERAAAPAAKMIMEADLPLDANSVTGGTTYLGLMAQGAAAYTGDPAFSYVDFGAAFGGMIYGNAVYHYDTFHPLEPGNALLAPKITSVLDGALAPPTARSFQRFGLLH